MTATLPRPESASSGVPLPNVALLARNLVIGGAERTFLNLTNHARRVTPIPILLRRRGGLLAEMSPDLQLHSLDADVGGGLISADALERMPGGSTAQLMLECRRLTRLLDAHEVPLVTSFLMRSHIVALLVKILFRPELKVVINIHEHTSESARYLYPNRRDLVLARWITRSLFPKADRIVVVADELRRDLVENFGISPALVQTAHNPVDLDRIRRMGSSMADRTVHNGDRRPVICAVGRLVYLKGYDILIRAVAELRKTLPVRLVIVGDGDERLPLESLVGQLGLQHDVRFVGWQGNPWTFMARADVVAVSSRTEAFPCVLTEAMALGIPTVASECSAGIRDCLDEGRAGLLVPPNDPHALARALHRVLTDRALASSLGSRGRERVAAFHLPDAVDAYESILLDVLAGREIPAADRAGPLPRTPASSASQLPDSVRSSGGVEEPDEKKGMNVR
ncbi:MAG TPA: glycosyltransferase [Gemmatimonadaceae bacterium]|nr:glycosyltransferase [Gemmatimonadaceae bacterium]